jgi:glyoxylase-like metal-dependent hydrolase (beta-lactamase superfamily II)
VSTLKAIGAKVEEVRAILLTHWHNDHAAGAHAIHALSGAPVYYHREDEPYYLGTKGATRARRWVSDLVPEIGVLVLLKGLLGESTPRAVAAQHLVHGAGIVMDDFEVIATSGHISFFYRPERALFAGDALAVIDGRIRFMARPVTLDLDAARQSLSDCLALHPRIVCPGRREPLLDAEAACEDMRRHLAAGGRWPLLG